MLGRGKSTCKGPEVEAGQQCLRQASSVFSTGWGREKHEIKSEREGGVAVCVCMCVCLVIPWKDFGFLNQVRWESIRGGLR